MKKQFGLTLMALLTAFSSMAFAAQGNRVDSHNSAQNSNNTTFLTDSEMQDAVGGGTTQCTTAACAQQAGQAQAQAFAQIACKKNGRKGCGRT